MAVGVQFVVAGCSVLLSIEWPSWGLHGVIVAAKASCSTCIDLTIVAVLAG